jgi:hypothetical protein
MWASGYRGAGRPLPNLVADHFLVAPDAVHVGSVEEGGTAVDRVMNRGDGFGVIRLAIELGHAHAAESLGGHDQRTPKRR